MYTSLVPSTPTVSPVTLSFMREHTRVTSSWDDGLLSAYLVSATEMVEMYLSRYLLTRTVTWTVSEGGSHDHVGPMYSMMPWQWSSFLRQPHMQLPRPCQSVTSVVIGIWGESDITLVEGTDYQLDLTGPLGRLRWIDSTFQNMLRDHIQIVFTSGYGAILTNAIPPPIIHAILLITTALYTSRGDDSPLIWTPAVVSLLANYRNVYFI